MFDDVAQGIEMAAEEADLGDVRGQYGARWCVEVAAAGGTALVAGDIGPSGEIVLSSSF